MSFLTNILYWISTSLLIPVIVILLISLIVALLMLGGFYGLYMNRLKFKNKARDFFKRVKKGDILNTSFECILEERNLFSEYLKMLIDLHCQPIGSRL